MPNITYTELHEKTGSTLARVRRGEQLVIVDRYGDPVAMLAPWQQRAATPEAVPANA